MELLINNFKLNVNNACKYLGIIIDNKLDFNIHIQALDKLSRSVGIPFKLQHDPSLSTLCTLYFCRSHLPVLHGLLIWRSVPKSRFKKVYNNNLTKQSSKNNYKRQI